MATLSATYFRDLFCQSGGGGGEEIGTGVVPGRPLGSHAQPHVLLSEWSPPPPPTSKKNGKGTGTYFLGGGGGGGLPPPLEGVVVL